MPVASWTHAVKVAFYESAVISLTLAGPVKVDLIFAGVPHEPEGPWEITLEMLTGPRNEHSRCISKSSPPTKGVRWP